jgi:hypothetical protein
MGHSTIRQNPAYRSACASLTPRLSSYELSSLSAYELSSTLVRLVVMRRLFAILCMGGGLLSCSTAGSRPPTTQPVVTPLDSVNARSIPRIRVLSPGTRSYQAQLTTISEEQSDSSPRLDSTRTTPRLSVSLQRVAGGAFLLQLQSEPWRVLTPDPASPASRLPSLVPVPLRMALDSLGMHATSLTQAGAACPTAGSEMFSPLGTRLLIVPGLLQTRENRTLQDSLTYRICSSGTLLEANLALSYTHDESKREPRVAPLPITVQLHGTIQGDSTRMLPMRLRGTLVGQARVFPDTGSHALASSVTADYVLTLVAESSIKRQNFRQTVHLELFATPADSSKR